MTVSVWAPGRVNLIGDHTDYADGLVLPMAIDLGTTITGTPGGDAVVLRSDIGASANVPIDIADPATAEPGMARYVAGVVAEVRPTVGFVGEVTSTLPAGSGLSSSAALEVAVALALDFDGTTEELARLTQLAEQRASGVPCGIMDQLAVAAGVADKALLIDCATLDIEPVDLPESAAITVIDSGQERGLVDTEYAQRRAQVEAAIDRIGPLRDRPATDADDLTDPVMARRARHVIGENARVRSFASAIASDDLAEAGALMVASHQSLREDFEVSTDVLDALVGRLMDTPGVHGARLTGAGFGGCVVALHDPSIDLEGWRVVPSRGAHHLQQQ